MQPILEKNDLHYVVDGKTNKGKLYNAQHQMIKEFEVFPHGANGPSQEVTGGDTVAELYLLGTPQWTGLTEDLETVRRPYGWVFIPMGDYEGKEAGFGRAGEGCHGGGHIADYWNPRQVLAYTHGCIRHHNEDVAWLAHTVEHIHSIGGKVWLNVTQ